MAGRYYKAQTLNVVVEVKLSAAEEQEKWLADALNVVKQQAFYMRRALPPPLPAFADSQDSGNLREALKYSAQMLSELRTSKLAPQKYYELCTRLKVHRIRTVPQPCVHGMADIVVCGELQNLEAFFWDEHKMRGRSCVDLYELVQHAGNIVPRLYLLCTVGAVYIRSKEGPAKEVLSDLSEVCKGVQHPIRGLFLRAHLTQCSRDKLPDTGSEYEGEGGTVVDAVEFLLQNFTEMNKLWVRMQHQGPATEREKREQERRELRDLVGKNLHLLSQLEGVNLDMYKTVVLPRILEQGRDSQQYLMDCLIQVFPDDFHLNTLETLLGACPECVHCIHPPSPPLSFPSSLVPFLIGPPFQIVNCRDEIAQQYLMDCLIQVFPDDFHLNTLETLLGACPELQPSVDVRTIMSQLMDRLSTFMDKNPDACLELQPSVDVRTIMSQLMDRLSTFMDKNPDVSAGSPAIPQRMSAQCSVKVLHSFPCIFDLLIWRLFFLLPLLPRNHQALPHFLEVDAFAKFNSAVSKCLFSLPPIPPPPPLPPSILPPSGDGGTGGEAAERRCDGGTGGEAAERRCQPASAAARHACVLTHTLHRSPTQFPPPRQLMEAQAEMPLTGVVSLPASLSAARHASVLTRTLHHPRPHPLPPSSGDGGADGDAAKGCGLVMEAQAEMPLKGVVSLHLALLQFVLRVHPDRLDYIDQVLAACVGILDARRQTKDSPTTKQLVALLSAALDKFGPGGVLTVLQLPHYARVMGHLDHETNKAMAVVIIQNMVKHETTIGDPEKVSYGLICFSPAALRAGLCLCSTNSRLQRDYARVMGHLDHGTNKAMAVVIIQNMVKHETTIGDPEKVECLLSLVRHLTQDMDGVPPVDELDMDDFSEEQNLVARLVHLLVNPDPRIQFQPAPSLCFMPSSSVQPAPSLCFMPSSSVQPAPSLCFMPSSSVQPAPSLCFMPSSSVQPAPSLCFMPSSACPHTPPSSERISSRRPVKAATLSLSVAACVAYCVLHIAPSLFPPLAYTCQILAIIRTHLFKGGQSRLRFTIPSLVFCSLQLVHQLLSQGSTGADQALATAGAAASQAAMAAAAAGEGPVTPLTLFLFLHKVVETLSEFVPPLALKLALECAQVASACGLEPIAYDLFTLAFVIYEEEISDSKAQVTALHLIIGTLQRCHVFAEENRDTLTHKATGYSAKLLKKADQCRAVCTCAHLFWSDEENGPRDGERVVLCLKRALKIANAAAQQLSAAARVPGSHVVLLVEILNKYLYFFDKGNPHVTPVVLQGLIELITSELAVDGATVDATVHSFYRATLAHIKDQKHKAGAIGKKYAEIQI
ncbi:unnamed protein product [Closterium sp. NIES-65]|nr:unnamed protein product [Closterium sp. NIES-65]